MCRDREHHISFSLQASMGSEVSESWEDVQSADSNGEYASPSSGVSPGPEIDMALSPGSRIGHVTSM